MAHTDVCYAFHRRVMLMARYEMTRPRQDRSCARDLET